MSEPSNYPPGVTGADIEEHFGNSTEDTCDHCGEPLEEGLCSDRCRESDDDDEERNNEENDEE
jgi:hypothetical protein